MIDIKSAVKNISVEEVKGYISSPETNFEYALIYMFSKVLLDSICNISSLDWGQISELFLFGPDGEIHVYRDGNDLIAVSCSDDKMSEFIKNEQKYELAGQFIETTKAKTVKVVEYLDKDEDGQIFVAYKRLAGLE